MMCYKYICYEWLYGLNKKIEKVLLFLGLNLEGNLLLLYWVQQWCYYFGVCSLYNCYCKMEEVKLLYNVLLF